MFDSLIVLSFILSPLVDGVRHGTTSARQAIASLLYPPVLAFSNYCPFVSLTCFCLSLSFVTRSEPSQSVSAVG